MGGLTEEMGRKRGERGKNGQKWRGRKWEAREGEGGEEVRRGGEGTGGSREGKEQVAVERSGGGVRMD